MADSRAGSVLWHLHHWLGSAAKSAEDGQLLERFVQQRDEEAFAELVSRHGPLVFGLCRRLLVHVQDAEDVFQATFLVLACKAASIRKTESLSCWLHSVAYRLALKAKAEANKRRIYEQQATLSADSAEADLSWREVRSLLDEELQRLPEKQRVPLVLCYLEGLTQDEAARRLGWPRGTLKRRLEAGRERLRLRLTRRGVTLGAGLFASALPESATKGAVPAILRSATVRAAMQFLTHKTAAVAVTPAALLAKGALQTMVMTKLKIASVLLLSLACAGFSASQFVQYRSAFLTAVAGKEAEHPQRPTNKAKTRGEVQEELHRTPRKAVTPSVAPPGGKAVARFPNAPGCLWITEPNNPPNLMATSGIVYIYEKDHDGAALITLAATLPRDRKTGYRPVLFDAAGKRYLPKPWGSSGSSGRNDGPIVILQRWRMAPQELPADKVARLGIEEMTPEYYRLAVRAALERARREGIEVLPCPELGKPFDFILTTIDGKKVHSRDLRGKVVLIDCWATWCSPCRALFPELKELYEKSHKDGLEIIGVNFDQDAAMLRKMCAKEGLAWPQVLVPADEKTRQLWGEIAGIGCMPRLFLIDRQGILRGDNPVKLKEEVARLLKDAGK